MKVLTKDGLMSKFYISYQASNDICDIQTIEVIAVNKINAQGVFRLFYPNNKIHDITELQ